MSATYNNLRFWRGRPCVYFLATPCKRFVKIGYTGHLEDRLRSLRNTSPLQLELLGAIDGTESDEKDFHAVHRERRLHGEWFMSDEEFAAMLECIAGLHEMDRRRGAS